MAKAFSPDTAGTLATGLVAFYRFEGNATDETGTNTGTVTGVGFSTDNGKIDQGAGFAGNNTTYINIGTDSSINFTGAYSINAWINVGTLGTGGSVIVGGYKNGSPYNGYAFKVAETATGNLGKLACWNGTSWVYSTSTVNNSTYRMVTLVSTGTQAKFYINGSASGTPSHGSPNSNTEVHYIGRSADTANWFAGKMDCLGLWSKALTTTEISDLYNSGNANEYVERGGDPPAPTTLKSRHALLGVGI